MTSLILAPALAMAASLIGAPTPEVPESQLVTYADLNLHSAQGKARLEQRVRAAADRLCRENDRATPDGGYLNTKCFQAAVADGAQQMQLAVARIENRQASSGSAIKLSRR
jgi:UrcA family protein